MMNTRFVADEMRFGLSIPIASLSLPAINTTSKAVGFTMERPFLAIKPAREGICLSWRSI